MGSTIFSGVVKSAVIGSCFVAGLAAHVARADLNCFDFATTNSPQRMRNDEIRNSRWCYREEKVDGRTSLFIFNADDARVKPELAALVSLTDDGRVGEVTHGSLSRGKVSILKSALAGFNPLAVPLTLDEAKRTGKLAPAPAHGMFRDAENVADRFRATHAKAFHYTIKEGVEEAYLEEKLMPYDAFWWPFEGVPLASGPYSPLGKYDGIVTKWTGTNPGSSAWEMQKHSLTNVPWGGHCNGWAASSLLYAEPTKTLWDADNEKVLLTSDLKGMLAESSFCVNWAFYGHRFYGSAGDDINDIYPDKFHNVLVYYMNSAKKSVAFDYVRDVSVDNSVISGYKFTITKSPANPKAFDVVAELRVHHYQVGRNEASGHAQSYTRTYAYQLETDDNGEVTKGHWTGGDNPDFLWVPLAQSNCSGENPNINPDNVVKIITTYPEAKAWQTDVNFTLNRKLARGESVAIPFAPTKGAQYQIAIGANNFDGDVFLNVHGAPLYPFAGDNQPRDFQVDLKGIQNAVIEMPLNDVDAISLFNPTDKPIRGSQLEIKNVQFMGAN